MAENLTEIALEHIRWCRGRGMTPRQILRSMGDTHWPIRPSFDHCIYAAETVLMQMRLTRPRVLIASTASGLIAE